MELSLRRRGLCVALAAAALVAASHAVAHAAPPTNDDFAAAQPIAVPQVLRGSTVGASFEPGEPQPDCVYSATSSVWFRVSASPGTVVLASTIGSDFDNALALWAGDSLESLTQLSCNSYGTYSYNSARARAIVPPGGVLYAQVLGQYDESGELRLATSVVQPPANDALGAATSVTELPYVHDVDLDGATIEANERELGCYVPSDAGTAWYTLTLPQSTRVRGAGYGAQILNVYTGTADALTVHRCGYESADFATTAGTTYWIQVGDGGDGGLATLELLPAPTPANDDFDNATVLNVGDRLRGSLDGATYEPDEPACAPRSTRGASVWYQFTVPADQVVRVRTDNYTVGVFRDTAFGFTQVACSGTVPYAYLVKSAAGMPVAAEAGVTYWVQVSQFFPARAPFTIDLLATGGI